MSSQKTTSRSPLGAACHTSSPGDVVERSEVLIKRNPVTATVTVFGLGIGLGVLAGVALADAAIAARQRRQPDTYGEQIYHALRRMAPQSFTS